MPLVRACLKRYWGSPTLSEIFRDWDVAGWPEDAQLVVGDGEECGSDCEWAVPIDVVSYRPETALEIAQHLASKELARESESDREIARARLDAKLTAERNAELRSRRNDAGYYAFMQLVEKHGPSDNKLWDDYTPTMTKAAYEQR